MTTYNTEKEQLDYLGQEIGVSHDLAQRIIERLKTEASVKNMRRFGTTRVVPRVKTGLAIAASLAICFCAWWLSKPQNVYAKMLQALSKSETIHITGWTRQLVRKWPLENSSSQGEHLDTSPPKHNIEIWHWSDPDGTPRSYERQGPVVIVRRGGDMREYQEDVDLMYFYAGGHNKDRVGEFAQLGEYLKLLQRSSLKKRELGKRNESGRTLRGIRLIEGNRIEDIWIDEESNLPQRLTRVNKNTGEQTLEISFTTNERVPDAIASYEPPKTQNVRYGGRHENTNLAWRQYVQDIGIRLRDKPIEGRIALLRRKNAKTFTNQWTLPTPDGKYLVMPLDIDQYKRMDFQSFMRLQAATEEGERRHGTWRVPKEFHDFTFPRADIVFEEGTPWREWMSVALNHFDLEIVDKEESRTVWIAKHDGQPLKPWQEVHPPVPYVVEGGVEKKGYVKLGIGHVLRPVPLHKLFADFNRLIDSKDLSGDKPWIIDETDLPKPPPYDETRHGTYRDYWRNLVEPDFLVATDSPWFVGKESIQMARNWYRKEFGITFEEVQKSVTVHVIRRKR